MNDDLTVLRCWDCGGIGEKFGTRCNKCAGSGSVFWVNGRAIPYTPAGEKTARIALASSERAS